MATTPYTVTLTDGTIFANISTGTINTASSMTLIGKNYAEYGQMLADNFIRLLENASNTTAPPAPITGQLWWDKTTTLLKVYSGTGWKNVGGATASGSQPTPSIVGDLWFNTVNQQLYVCSVAGAPGTFIVVGAAVNNPGNITFAIANTVVSTVSSTGAFVTGLISATGNITGSNITTSGLATVTGNIQGGNLTTAGLVSAIGTVTGSSLLGSVVSASGNVTGGNVLTGGVLSAGGTITGSSLLGSVVSASGNVTGGNIVTAGFATVTGNIQGGNLITVGVISASSTITGSQFNGSGSGLTSIPGGNVSGTVANATYAASAGSATTATTAGTANSVAGANVSGTVANATYATSAGSATTTITATFAGTANAVAGANVSGKVANATYSDSAGAAGTAGSATFAGTANAVAGGNVSGTVANATYATSAGSATTAGTVTTGTQGNITGVGTLTSLSVTGNITGGNVLGGANVNATTHTGTTVSVSGNVNGGNIVTLGGMSAAGTITGATISSTGSVTGANVQTSGNVNITGTGRLVATGIEFTNYSWSSIATTGGTTNIPGGVNQQKRVFVFTGTSNQYVGLPLTAYNTVVPEFYIINKSTGTLFIQDTVGFDLISVPSGASCTLTGVLTSTTGVSSWQAALNFANFISVTGTVTGSQFTGSGAGLTSIPGGNVSGTVANATYATTAGSATTAGTATSATSATTAGTVTTAAQPSITSVGVLTSLSTTGNVTTTNRLVATGIEFTNYAWTSIATTGGTTNLPGGVNQQKRVFVFTGTSNQYIGMPLTTYNTVVPEFYIINKSTGTLYIEDAVGFSIATIPSGAACTVTGVFTSTPGADYWRASVGATNFALACGGQTWQDVSASRNNNATYTNSTGRPIQVSIYAYYAANQSIELKVDAITIALAGWSSYAYGYVGGTVSAIVPPGSTYQCYTATGVSVIQKWLELR